MDQPPREPPDPLDETIVRDEWGEETVVVEESEVLPPRRRPPLIWPALLALLVLVLGGLAAVYYFTRDDDGDAAPTTAAATTQTGTVSERKAVPDVVGQRAEEAVLALQAAGLDATVAQVFSGEPVGTVLEQNPAAGAELERGGLVRLTASKGERPGTTTVTTVTTVATTTTATTATMPTTTQPAPPPAQPARTTVPEAVGESLAVAARAFGAAGLKVAVQLVPSAEPRGTVIAQAQPAGTERRRGDTVQVNVALGPEPQPDAAVPEAVGLSEPEARARLVQAGFEVLAIEVFAKDESQAELVLSQTPGAGARIPQGSLVILYAAAATR